MEYYFDELDPVKFQRLVNAILVARFGEDLRLTPLRGKDGGRDAETAPGYPNYYQIQVKQTSPVPTGLFKPPRRGRYLFQVKHHRTTDKRLSDIRQVVIDDFETELKTNVLNRKESERVNYFFLITNVPSSRESLDKVDQLRRNLPGRYEQNLYADVWWQERVITFLDQMPSIWISFPEMFAGSTLPMLAKIVDQRSEGLPRGLRLAINRHYDSDKNIKFRQIELEQNLSKLFVDLDVDLRNLSIETQRKITIREMDRSHTINGGEIETPKLAMEKNLRLHSIRRRSLISALSILLNEDNLTSIPKLILEGGPGQGKSTISQMVAQIYRQQILNRNDMDPDHRWISPEKIRLPFRFELRKFAEWLGNNQDGSIEEYLTIIIRQDSGGNQITVDDIHSTVEKSSVLLIFDGLDEVGSDKLRDKVLIAIKECIQRFESGLKTDLRVIITTRPPALAGRRNNFIDFEQLQLAPMEKYTVDEYISRWLAVQIREEEEKTRIKQSFERRRNESHVEALAKNPMQLSVLLQFINLKGEAFPDRRAELYRDYFQIVIDREVEKNPELRENRDIIEALHAFLGYKIHALTEINQADRTLSRLRLISMVESWLAAQGHTPSMARQFFRLGEERFGLIVASKGEGEETKYGYEVQPIQEYFAAAFISNQISASSAHDVFQEMIRRPYWREVALFLAGLRRPNEKVDLIARAKAVDLDKQLGWYQDGRAIILSLLQEGVFSEPRYVYSEALDFMLDLFDVRKIKVQREPENLLPALELLISRNPLENHKERILQLIQEYKTSEDLYVLRRIYRGANLLLNRDEYANAVISHEGTSPYLVAMMRLGWSHLSDAHLKNLAQTPSFWHGVPDSIWAETLWQSTIRRGVALDLKVPISLHEHLIKLYITFPMNERLTSPRRLNVLELNSNLAVWILVHTQQLLQAIIVSRDSKEKLPQNFIQNIASISIDNSDSDYDGLDESLASTVKDIIQLCRNLLISISRKSKEGKAYSDYVQGLRTHLQLPGLGGWVACKCLVNLFQYILIKGNVFGEPNIKPILDDKQLYLLAEEIQPFYDAEITDKKQSTKENHSPAGFLLRRFSDAYIGRISRIEIVPTHIRLEKNERPISLVSLLVDNVRNEVNLPYEWMNSIPFTSSIIRHLIEECGTCLPDTLIELNKHQFTRIGGDMPLRVQYTQRILKIARETDDAELLTGVCISLQNANFLRIAESTLVSKLLHFDSSSILAFGLFKMYKDQIEDRHTNLVSKDLMKIAEIANSILDTPGGYPFRTVCYAANFLAENIRIDLPPLINQEEKMGIK